MPKPLTVDLAVTVPEPVEALVRALVRKSYQIAKEEARDADYRPSISPEAVLGALLHFAPPFVEGDFEGVPKLPEEEAPKASKKTSKKADA